MKNTKQITVVPGFFKNGGCGSGSGNGNGNGSGNGSGNGNGIWKMCGTGSHMKNPTKIPQMQIKKMGIAGAGSRKNPAGSRSRAEHEH